MQHMPAISVQLMHTGRQAAGADRGQMAHLGQPPGGRRKVCRAAPPHLTPFK